MNIKRLSILLAVLISLISILTTAQAASWEGGNPSPNSQKIDIPVDGESEKYTIRVRNNGTETWYRSGSNKVSINYRWEPGDSTGDTGESKFYCNDWETDYKISYMKESSVSPGSTASFDVWFCNPTNESPTSGYNWHEHFAIAYGTEWMPYGSDVSKVFFEFRIAAAGKPDLDTNSRGISSGPYYAGDTISVQADVKNYGESDAGSSTVAFWIAASDTGPPIDGNIETRNVSSLGPKNSSNDEVEDLQTTLTIPASLSPGTYYVIYEADHDNDVDESDEDNISYKSFVVSEASLSPPTNLQASDNHTDKIALIWDAATGASGYEVWRHTTNSSASATKIADVSGTSYNDTSATPGTTYYYWVKAKSGSSTSDFSNADSGLRTAITAPDAPTLSAINNPDGDGNYTVSWGAVIGATSYEYQAANNASFTSPQDGSTSGTSWNVTGQSDGTYYYRVRACDTLCSAWSNVQSVTVCQTPSLPTNPAPSHNATNQAVTVNLSWGNDGSGATPASYDLYFGTAASPPLLATVTGSSYDLPNLTESTSYNWRLVAKTACGGSSNGPVWTFTTAAPSVGSYSISGTVKDNAGNPLSGVTISFNGARPNVTTGPTGQYTQSGFSDGSYTVSPSKAGYSFTAQSVTVSGSDKTGVDFVGTSENYSISGKVTDGSGNPLSGVSISFGGARPAVTTDVNGQYSQTGFGSGSYTVTPSKTGYNFTGRSVTISGANQANINFSGTTVSYSISGKVTDSAGNPLSGVTISFGGARPDVTTNVSGQYNQTGFLNGSYSVTATKTGYTFTGQTVTVNNGNQTGIDFAGAVATYTISGYVKDSSNNPLSGVTISFNGAADDVTTDDTGYYSQSGFSNGTYQVTPTKGGQTFNNTPRSVTVNGADVPNVNFVSYAAIPFDLHISDLLVTNADSGTVIKENSTIAPGTKIELRAWVENKGPGNGGSVDLYYYDNNAYIDDDRTTSLDAGEVDDEYEKFTVSSTGQHILKVVIDPENEYEETNEGNNERTFKLNVEESANTYSISGRVTDGSGNGLANITVSFGGLRPSVTTNSSGNYSQTGFANGSYSVTPSGGSCPFSPASQSVTISGGNGSANFSLNCTAAPIWAASPVGSTEINVTIIGSGSSDYQSVQYRNTGNMTWLDYGADRVVLSYRREDSDTGGSYNGTGWESAFRCANWPSQSRYWAATISPASVSPNGTGSFTMQFCNRNNETPGEYVEHFDIAHGGTWFNNQGWTGRVTVRITVLPEGTIPTPTPTPNPTTPWAAEVLGTKIFNVTIQGNGGISEKVTVQYKNTGQNSWRNVGTEPVVLSYRHDSTTDGGYENSPGNWESLFRCEGMWPDDNPYWAAKVSPDGVATNSTGTFEMFFCNNRNKTPGTYTERFDVAHGGAWFYDGGWSGEVIVQVTVLPGDVDTYSISGEVLDDDSNGVANVTINFSDGRTTTTGSNGSYSLSGFVDGSTYTVTPSKSGYSFIPPSRERTISGRNETNVSFIGRGSSSGGGNCSAEAIDTYLTSKSSPLAGYGSVFVQKGNEHNVDPRLVVAIAGAESSFGKNLCPNNAPHNAWGWMTNSGQCMSFSSWDAGIERVTSRLRTEYIDLGFTSINKIAGKYCVTGCGNWIPNVTQFYRDLGGNPDTNDLSFEANCGASSNTPKWRAFWVRQYHPNEDNWDEPIVLYQDLDIAQTYWVEFRNTGTETWSNNPNSPNAVSLNVRFWRNEDGIPISTDPELFGKSEGTSVFSCLGWTSDSRVGYLEENSVAPGEIGTFRFKFCTPPNPLLPPSPHYIENFELGYGSGTWFPTYEKNIPRSWFPISVISSSPQPPQVDAGPNRTGENGIRMGESFDLNGTNSFDPDGGTVTYNWTIIGTPNGSESYQGTAIPMCSLFSVGNPVLYVPNCTIPANYEPFKNKGTWRLRLTVTDDEGQTATDTMVLEVKEGGFLDLPVNYSSGNFVNVAGSRFNGRGGAVNSWFDHFKPNYDYDNTLRRWDGKLFSGNNADRNNCSRGKGCYEGHNGLDFTNAVGTDIYAVADGVVIKTVKTVECTECKGYGNYIVIDHGNGYFTLYGHLKFGGVLVNEGQNVTQRQKIGIMGTTGGSKFVHLHFSVYKGWAGTTDKSATNVVDPYGWEGGGTDPCFGNYCKSESESLWKDKVTTNVLTGRSSGRQNRQATDSTTLVSISGNVTVTIPTDAFPYTTTINLKELFVSETITQHLLATPAFLLNVPAWYSDTLTAPTTMRLRAPLELTINFSPENLTHLDLDSLSLYYQNPTTKNWEYMIADVNMERHQVVAQTGRLGRFSLQAPLKCPIDDMEPYDDYPPVEEGEMIVIDQLLKADGTPVQRWFDTITDRDWFRLTAQAGVNYTIWTQNLTNGANTIVGIYDADDTLLMVDNNSGDNGGSLITWQPPQDGTYYIKVEPNSDGSSFGCETSYELVAQANTDTLQLNVGPAYTAMALNWNPVNDSTIISYRINRAVTNTTTFAQIATLTDTIYIYFDMDEALEEDEEYCYQIEALDDNDNVVVTSNTACSLFQTIFGEDDTSETTLTLTAQAPLTETFTFTGTMGQFSLTTGEPYAMSNIITGTHTLTLTAPAGWQVQSMVCDGQTIPVSEGRVVEFELLDSQAMACTLSMVQKSPTIYLPLITK